MDTKDKVRRWKFGYLGKRPDGMPNERIAKLSHVPKAVVSVIIDEYLRGLRFVNKRSKK